MVTSTEMQYQFVLDCEDFFTWPVLEKMVHPQLDSVGEFNGIARQRSRRLLP